MSFCFLPPYLLRQIAQHALSQGRPEDAEWVEQMLTHDDGIRLRRTTLTAVATGPAWVVHDAHHGSGLPGDLVRSPGDAPTGDLAVDEAAEGVAAALAMFEEVYGRDSYDDAGATVMATVHYQRNYDNAFWNGAQLVFGDGDGRTFDRFTKPVDVLGHELTHAVTERTAGLVYEGQSGALNESVSDVFASCLKQRLLGQDAGRGRLADRGRAVPARRPGAGAARHGRTPARPTTTPSSARTRSPPTWTTTSRRPTTTVGFTSTPGSPTAPSSSPRSTIGGSSCGGCRPDLVRRPHRWTPQGRRLRRASPPQPSLRRASTPSRSAGRGAPSASPRTPRPRARPSRHPSAARGPAPCRCAAAAVSPGGWPRARSTSTPAAECAPELAELVDRIDLRAVSAGLPMPDMFIYAFDLCGDRATVPEQHLTADLRRVAELVLDS